MLVLSTFFNAIRGLGFSEVKNMCKTVVKCNMLIRSSQRSAFFGWLLDAGLGGGLVRGLAGWLASGPVGWLAGRLVGWLVGRHASKRQRLAPF